MAFTPGPYENFKDANGNPHWEPDPFVRSPSPKRDNSKKTDNIFNEDLLNSGASRSRDSDRPLYSKINWKELTVKGRIFFASYFTSPFILAAVILNDKKYNNLLFDIGLGIAASAAVAGTTFGIFKSAEYLTKSGTKAFFITSALYGTLAGGFFGYNAYKDYRQNTFPRALINVNDSGKQSIRFDSSDRLLLRSTPSCDNDYKGSNCRQIASTSLADPDCIKVSTNLTSVEKNNRARISRLFSKGNRNETGLDITCTSPLTGTSHSLSCTANETFYCNNPETLSLLKGEIEATLAQTSAASPQSPAIPAPLPAITHSALSTLPPASMIPTFIVTASAVNLREEPNVQSKPKGTLTKDSCVTFISGASGFVRVGVVTTDPTDNYHIGYVSYDYLMQVKQASTTCRAEFTPN